MFEEPAAAAGPAEARRARPAGNAAALEPVEPLPAPTRLNRQSLGSQIAQQLRQDILLGRLEPGSLVSQRELCIQYGTSRMPVRDALRQLAYEGLVVSSPSSRSVVAALTTEDIEDSFLVEAVVHSRAARRATEYATGEDIAALESLHEQMLAATRSGDLESIVDLNWRFHGRINVLAGSAKLLALIRTVSVGVPREYLVEIPEWADRSNAGHAEILSAMQRRDTDAVVDAVRRHVEEAGTNLAAYLETRGLIEAAVASAR